MERDDDRQVDDHYRAVPPPSIADLSPVFVSAIQLLPQCNVYHNASSTTMQRLPQCIQPQCIILLIVIHRLSWDHSHPHIVMHPQHQQEKTLN